ncbi:MAG: LuxR family transcriptional regulator [Myxococcota bacterium]
MSVSRALASDLPDVFGTLPLSLAYDTERITWLRQAIHRLESRLPGEPEVFEDLAEQLTRLGFEYTTYIHLLPDREMTFRSTLPNWWKTVYRQRRLQEVDPLIHIACRRYRPSWAGAPLLSSRRLSKAQRDFVAEESSAGLVSGVAVPVVTGRFEQGEPVAGWVIGTRDDGENTRDRWRVHGQAIHLVTALAHQRMMAQRFVANPLSRREQDCLRGLADGLQMKQVAGRLGIAYATVEFHLRNARRKLSAETTAQTLALAAKAGFV